MDRFRRRSGARNLAAELNADHIPVSAGEPLIRVCGSRRNSAMNNALHQSARAFRTDRAQPAAGGRRWRTVGKVTSFLVVLAAIVGCAPIATLNSMFVSGEGYRIDGGLAYGPERRQVLDVYVPEEMTPPARVVVFFYGGAWRSGSRDYYRFLGQALTSRGFVVVIPDYRVAPDVRFPAFVEDGGSALRWVRQTIATYGGDPDDIWLMGHSAGAHIGALIVTDDRYLAAAGVPRENIRGFVGLAGPYAFDPLKYAITRDAFAGLETAEPAQPMTYVDGDEPPMLLLHGAADETVWPVNAHVFAERVNAAGGRAEVIDVPDAGHIGLLLSLSEAFRGSGEVFAVIVRFLSTGQPLVPSAP
jgi:acetyl esterase/lipase